jgi:DNA-binding NarL/FixJ family response regulator
MLAWQDSPRLLGSAFERLTEREWVVLRGLNSDDGEKQLADRLSLSPHTLHSHIKSIYRKVGVQGRLPLLLRLNTAIRELRQTSINSVSAPRHEPQNLAVAVG